MPTTLLLIRHGQTPWNALGKIQGCTNIVLEEAGKIQAQLLAEKLQGQFTAIYSSPLDRALETAQILATPNHLLVHSEEALREINFGLWEGLTFKEVAATYPAAYRTWQTDELEAPLCGGDGSIKNCSIRSKKILLELVQKHPNETIAAVSHGGLIKAALIGLFDLKMTMYHQMSFGNTCVTTICFTDDLRPILMGLNDTSHLGHIEARSI
ncbi:MAG: histidine phosphatase family protein [Cellulosilyticum sp.]|nr:histidine phosphatase family protein [Cellulosilyticum sp.]